MSLFGAMQSGVSGLTSQASAMGSISDNIANVSTVGYKRTQVNFQTLVTAQTSRTTYAPGGVQSKPRQDTGVQGLLKSTTSSTDIAIAGGGFFVVNQARQPGINDEYVFTRAGSFFMDKEGYLMNTSGYYLQAWPTDAQGNVIPANRDLSTPNQGVITTDYVETINLRTIGSSAAATTRLFASANLPSDDEFAVGDGRKIHRMPWKVHDSLGGTHNLNTGFYAGRRENTWEVTLNPPPGVEVLTLRDDDSMVYRSVGQLEFTDLPPDGATVVIEGRTYEFDTDGNAEAQFNDPDDLDNTGGDSAASVDHFLVDISNLDEDDLAEVVERLVNRVIESDSDFTAANDRIQVSDNSPTTVLFVEDGTHRIGVDPRGLLNADGVSVVRQKDQFEVLRRDDRYSETQQFQFDAANPPVDGDTVMVNGITYEFNTAGDGLNDNANIAVILGAGGGATTPAYYSAAQADLAQTLNNLRDAIRSNDPDFTDDLVVTRAANRVVLPVAPPGAPVQPPVDTLVLSKLGDDGGYVVNFENGWGADAKRPRRPGTVGVTGQYSTGDNTVDRRPALEFNREGRPLDPRGINVKYIEMKGFDNGAADMDSGTGNSERIELDLGRLDQANGLTQLSGRFNVGTVQQNGKEFGIFNGLVVSDDGKVTVKFTNGDKRVVYQIPLATFTNTNQLGMLSGNVWNQTEDSGDYTLRTAGIGVAGKVKQASLEQSNVDIGSEFTDMIVVQRAYSASARIISTSDEMLEELMRTKR